MTISNNCSYKNFSHNKIINKIPKTAIMNSKHNENNGV